MDKEDLILEELRRIRVALEASAPKRWQKIPDAAVTLSVPEYRLRKLADSNQIPVMVLSRTKVRKVYMIDIVKTRLFLEQGALIPKVRTR